MRKVLVVLSLGLALFLGVWDAFSEGEGDRGIEGPNRGPGRSIASNPNASAPDLEAFNPLADEPSETEEPESSAPPEEVDPADETAIRGQVLGPDGRPCVGFRLIFWEQSVTTDANGRFRLQAPDWGGDSAELDANTLHLDHEKWSFDPESFRERSDSGEYLLRARRPGSLELQVIDRSTGLPVLEYDVRYVSPDWGPGRPRHFADDIEIDEFGMSFFEEVMAGLLTFTVTHEDYFLATETVEVHPGKITRTAVSLDRHPSVFGQVTDPQGRPLAGAEVWLNRETQKTAEDGTFLFEKLSPNSFLLRIVHPDALPLPERRFLLELGEERDLGALVLERGGQLSGTLSLASGRSPHWAHVRVESENGKIEKKAQYDKRTRRYSVSGVLPGRYRLVVNYAAYGDVSTHRTELFELPAGAPQTHDFTLPTD